MTFGPNSTQVEDFLARLPTISDEAWLIIGDAWRRAPRYPGSQRRVNLNVVSAVLQATDTMEMRRLLEELQPGNQSPLPVPSDDQLLRMVKAGEEARQLARSGGADIDAQEAAAGVAGVLALRPWAADPLVENVTATFNDVWPDWPTTQEPWSPAD
jgi:hypothetical protein